MSGEIVTILSSYACGHQRLADIEQWALDLAPLPDRQWCLECAAVQDVSHSVVEDVP